MNRRQDEELCGPLTSPAPQVAASGQGVYYSPVDYAGPLRRFSVELIDGFVLFVGVFLLVTLSFVVMRMAPYVSLAFSTLALALPFLYLVLLKRSTFRTIGYRIAGVRIVNLQGDRPGLWSLTIRLIAMFVPNVFIDLLWASGDRSRQALHDKWAHTYVVRSRSVPAGRGPIRYEAYTFLGGAYFFPEVREAPPSDRQGSGPATSNR